MVILPVRPRLRVWGPTPGPMKQSRDFPDCRLGLGGRDNFDKERQRWERHVLEEWVRPKAVWTRSEGNVVGEEGRGQESIQRPAGPMAGASHGRMSTAGSTDGF